MEERERRRKDLPMADPVDQSLRKMGNAMWGSAFVTGLLLMLTGLIALSASWLTGVISVLFLGVLLAFSGIAEVFHAVGTRGEGRPLIHLLAGVLSAVVGFLLIFRTGSGLVALTLLLAGYFLASGCFHAITALVERHRQWGWDFFYGAVSILLGVMVIRGWPVSSLWLIGTLVGVEILFRGIALMSGGLGMRRLMRSAHV